jgi:hypothetical protein
MPRRHPRRPDISQDSAGQLKPHPWGAGLCHDLCRNPAIPVGAGPTLAVSLGYKRKAANMPETRMNTASQCHSVSFGFFPSDFTR